MIAKEVRSESTPWKAAEKFRNIVSEASLNNARDYIVIIYNGEPLQFSYTINHDDFKPATIIKYSMHRSHVKREILGKSYHSRFEVSPGGKTIFVAQDEEGERVPQNKARSLVTYDDSVIFINTNSEKLTEVLGGVDIVFTSTIEKPKPKKNSNTAKTSGKPFIQMEENGFFDTKKSFSFKEMGENVYYIPINRFKPLDGKNKMSNSEFASLIKNARTLGIIKETDIVYGVLGWGVTQYVKGPQFKNVLLHVRSNLDNSFKKEKLKI